MSKKKVISSKNLKFYYGRMIIPSMTIYLFMDKFKAPEWAYGLIFGLLGLIFIVSIGMAIKDETVEIDIFEELDKKQNKP